MNHSEEFKKFLMIFWFCVGICAFAFLYAIGITFFPMPKGHERWADMTLSFCMGTVVGGAISFLMGGSATTLKKPSPPAGTTSAQITASVITENANTNENGGSNNVNS